MNIISGWQRREYTQMGIWPGAEHYKRRYDYCAEYVTDHAGAVGDRPLRLQGRLLPDGRLPLPADADARTSRSSAPAQSDAGTRYAAQYADYNFCSSCGINTPNAVDASVARLVAGERRSRHAIVARWS